MSDLIDDTLVTNRFFDCLYQGRLTGGDKVYRSDLNHRLINEWPNCCLHRVILKTTNEAPASDSPSSLSHSAGCLRPDESERPSPAQGPSQSPSQPPYDVFISYNKADKKWVRDELLPRLEAAGLSVAVDYRDFIAGGPRLTETEQAVEKSQHTIVVLTPAWLQDDWNAFEALLLRTLDPAARQRKLIPLLYKHCEQLPEAIAALERVDFADEAHWEREFERLIRAVKASPLPPPMWRRGRVGHLVQQHPVISTMLAVSIFALLTLVIVLQLPGFISAIQQMRQPGNPLFPVLPAPTATNTPTATHTPIPPTPTTSPMPESGFNIAVAQFTTLSSSDDSLLSSPESKELSEWLFNTISKRVDGLPPSYRVSLRGPDEVEPIIGQKITDRNAHATQVAKKHNATLLIYGQVVQMVENVYLVQPEFFVSAQGFRYGDEIVGPNLLGKPIQFLPPLARDDLLQDINEKLDIRIEVLSFIVEGLVAYHIGHNDEAYGKFEETLNLSNWQSDEGYEVVHLLMGAAKLRKYGNLIGLNPDRPPDTFAEVQQILTEAEDHFQQAHQLNHDYARSYLGLAAVAIFEATIFKLRQAHLAEVDLDRLQDAKYWYSEGLNDETDQSPLAYVRVKAAYGLGQVYLAEYTWYRREAAGAQANEAKEKARSFFRNVIIAYNEVERASGLTFMAGTTRAQLALLAGFEGQYENVISECEEAIVILETLEADAPFDYIANCHYWMALAHENQAAPNLDSARRHYEQAIKIGKDSGLIAKEDLEKWEAARDRLN